MISIKKALVSDFEEIYPLLLEFHNSNLTKHDWMQLFVNHCGSGEDYFGYSLFDQDRIIGFLGLIFSARLINGKMEKFCNLTSLIIRKEYRRQGLSRLLLLEALKSKEHTILALTPDPKTVKMYKDLGFKELEDRYQLILPVPSPRSFFNDCSVITKQDAIPGRLKEGERKIYNDHSIFKCIHILIKTGAGNCYIIARKKILKKRIPFAEIYFISDLDVFLKAIDAIRVMLPLKLRVLGLLIEERFLRGRRIRHSKVLKFRGARLFKSSSLDRAQITDNLYTELLILDL